MHPHTAERGAREFDIVAYGATGFTGQLVCEYLKRRCGMGVRWALAGRELGKLARIRDTLGLSDTIPLLHADAEDIGSVRAVSARTHALISTVGPYQLNGSTAVEACATTGTDYLDMSGEPVWMREMMDACNAAAQVSGARILFSCGFDSIPFDLSVYRLQQLCIARWGQPSARIRCRVLGLKGGISGGTAATKRATEAAVAKRPEIPALLADPFLLTPGWRGAEQPSADAIAFDATIGCWTAPFYMAFINTKHVHRTNLLRGHAYGREFRYDEMIAVPGQGEAGRQAAELRAAFDPFTNTDTLRSGDGPEAAERASNFFDLLFLADGPRDERLAVTCRGALDPGYEGTARMLVESALCLTKVASTGGFWTPAALLGDGLIDALSTQAGIRFEAAEPSLFTPYRG